MSEGPIIKLYVEGLASVFDTYHTMGFVRAHARFINELYNYSFSALLRALKSFDMTCNLFSYWFRLRLASSAFLRTSTLHRPRTVRLLLRYVSYFLAIRR